MRVMRFIAVALLTAVCLSLSAGVSANRIKYACHGVTDLYDFKMCVKVPRIYDNMTSQGKRVYQSQSIKGILAITYPIQEDERPSISIYGLTNQIHKINGRKIGYSCIVDDDAMFTRVNLIGDNKKNKFNVASVCFYLDAEPDYNLGEDDEDNSLLVVLAGRGSAATYTTTEKVCGKRLQYKAQVIYSMYGNVAGTLGCGCKAYGHISPTRVAGPDGPTEIVDDVAAVFGTWSAKYRGSILP